MPKVKGGYNLDDDVKKDMANYVVKKQPIKSSKPKQKSKQKKMNASQTA